MTSAHANAILAQAGMEMIAAARNALHRLDTTKSARDMALATLTAGIASVGGFTSVRTVR